MATELAKLNRNRLHAAVAASETVSWDVLCFPALVMAATLNSPPTGMRIEPHQNERTCLPRGNVIALLVRRGLRVLVTLTLGTVGAYAT